ncbi:hypothetical protein SEMRO_806_G205040.1 [Seminavis robusta]|uniref:Uncharacterized protein n=1 Tax=Seminavis robusta TaxID=568900 RepID=A0A9N8ECN7_9STRA|nr:hypothetical protein SEMRO_806_G205040.1 [Seminavis robusta]|eukprot:Sro806_g205040.1 n/a (180) ;mRNA; r:4793-5332
MFGRYTLDQFSFMADATNKDTGKKLTFTVNGDMTSFTVRFQDHEEEEAVEATQVLPSIAVAEPLPSTVASATPAVDLSSSEISEEEDDEFDKDDFDELGMEQEVDFLTNGLDTSVNILDTTDSSSDYDEVGGFSQEQFFTPIKKAAQKKPIKKKTIALKPAAVDKNPALRKQPSRRSKK